MINTKARNYLLATTTVLALFAGCKGESPTSPSSTPTPPGGSVTPPAGAAITLTVSNAQPQVDSTSVITATVTLNNSPVSNGTAVEFVTNLGTFTEANAQSVIRTTTNGVATITLTSSTAGEATITATVNNVAKSTKVTFNLKPVTPGPPDLTPVITSITPSTGRPQGGELLTINGKNFSSPKVIFDFGGGKTADAFLVSATPTQIQVLTPSVDLGTGQQKTAQIIVINNAGTTSEVRITASTTFTFQAEVLTPKITTVSPASGPTEGGTRVTIFGEGFQAPVQVFFGSAEVSLAAPVTFNQLVVISPNASQTTPTGSGTVTGPVDIKVINIQSATTVTASSVFRYITKMLITTITPTSGSALGGTDIEISGQGLTGDVTVDVGQPAVRASVIGVFGTRILARTGRLASPCASNSGPVTVTAVGNGDNAASSAPQVFTYFPINPFITSASSSASPITLGSPFTFIVNNPGIGLSGDAVITATLADKAVPVVPNPITVGTGPVTFSSAVPTTGITFPTVSCTVGALTGTQFGPLSANLVFTNTTTSCTATLLNALTIQPVPPNTCVIPPTATLTSPAQSCPVSNLSPATVASAGAVTHTATITITNATGASTLNLGAPSVNPTNATVTVAPNTATTVAGGGSQSYTVTVDPTAAGADGATITFTTNDPTKPTIVVTVCGNAT